MTYTKIDAFKNFVLQHRKAVVFSVCLIFCVTLLFVFSDSYSKRYDNNDFSELQAYLLQIKEKDKSIYNNLNLREIKKETKGIDVSSWQKDIDWEKVKNSGIDFVMIRCGFRNLTIDSIQEDSKFKYNISEANRLGIPVGVYFYSTARNEREIMEEASFVLNLIKDYDVMYPVAYDFELYNQKRMKDVSASRINDNAVKFLDYMDAHGYKGMIYSNLSYLERVWDLENFENYKLWLAQYDGTVSVEYDMIQHTDKGTIDGISTKVDMNKANFAFELVEES